MPIKHQTESFRNRNGQRFVCDGDIWNGRRGDLREMAKARVKELRAAGNKAFFETQEQGGFYRVFVEAGFYGESNQ